jgi:hypothetical protein
MLQVNSDSLPCGWGCAGVDAGRGKPRPYSELLQKVTANGPCEGCPLSFTEAGAFTSAHLYVSVEAGPANFLRVIRLRG